MLLDEKAIAGIYGKFHTCVLSAPVKTVVNYSGSSWQSHTVILPFVGKVREGDFNGNKNILIFISIFIPPKTKDFRVRKQAFHWWI